MPLDIRCFEENELNEMSLAGRNGWRWRPVGIHWRTQITQR